MGRSYLYGCFGDHKCYKSLDVVCDYLNNMTDSKTKHKVASILTKYSEQMASVFELRSAYTCLRKPPLWGGRAVSATEHLAKLYRDVTLEKLAPISLTHPKLIRSANTFVVGRFRHEVRQIQHAAEKY